MPLPKQSQQHSLPKHRRILHAPLISIDARTARKTYHHVDNNPGSSLCYFNPSTRNRSRRTVQYVYTYNLPSGVICIPPGFSSRPTNPTGSGTISFSTSRCPLERSTRII